jgi:hypothetical protein
VKDGGGPGADAVLTFFCSSEPDFSGGRRPVGVTYFTTSASRFRFGLFASSTPPTTWLARVPRGSCVDRDVLGALQSSIQAVSRPRISCTPCPTPLRPPARGSPPDGCVTRLGPRAPCVAVNTQLDVVRGRRRRPHLVVRSSGRACTSSLVPVRASRFPRAVAALTRCTAMTTVGLSTGSPRLRDGWQCS